MYYEKRNANCNDALKSTDSPSKSYLSKVREILTAGPKGFGDSTATLCRNPESSGGRREKAPAFPKVLIEAREFLNKSREILASSRDSLACKRFIFDVVLDILDNVRRVSRHMRVILTRKREDWAGSPEVLAEAWQILFYARDISRLARNVLGASLNVSGSSRNASGCSLNVSGSSRNASGCPLNVLGSSRNASGCPLNVLGSSRNASGCPLNVLGSSRNVSGCSRNVLGSSRNASGCPLNDLGSSRNASGCSLNVLGCFLKPMEIFPRGIISGCLPLTRGPP